MNKELSNISKFLSLVLRHKPELIGIEMDTNGWVDVDDLIKKSCAYGTYINIDILKTVVESNNKKRFSFNETFDKIRANQGHSINIELGYEPKEPPKILYHGTAEHNLKSILDNGIHKQKRHHVHLTTDNMMALNVGTRHGKPIVLIIDCESMYKDNYIFYLTDNNVWLTDHVPQKYITYAK